jgi:predicted nucleotidyltransferase component of viral defense system
MMSKTLPEGPWRTLFPRAMTLIEEIRRYGGVEDPFWTIGGGTVLMFRHCHRMSKDIDIFVPDPQYLGYVTPRLSDTAAEMTQDYIESGSSFVKLQFEEGEVDFVASPNLLVNAWEVWDIDGHAVKVETAAEIVAKKLYHRGNRATARDLFDIALVVEREPEQLRQAEPFLLQHRDAFLSQVHQPHPSLRAAFDAIAALDYRPGYEHCVSVVDEFLMQW